MMLNSIPRPEHPTPQLMRKHWINLNGQWQFQYDYGFSGAERGFEKDFPFEHEITVPFCPESSLSGIGNTDFMNCIWYRRTFALPEEWSERTFLHIGACDYEADVWINGRHAGNHIGGYVSFSFDITDFLQKGENTITIRAIDRLRDFTQPGGKQCGQYASYGCSYTRTTGIWQTVWLEGRPSAYIESFKLTPLCEQQALLIEAVCKNAGGKKICAEAFWEDAPAGKAEATVCGESVRFLLPLSVLKLWEAGNGALYDLRLSLYDDAVESYFAMRSLSWKNGCLHLNGRPIFQRLVLDQGFYPDGIYTAPTEEALKRDIELSMAMGFNGARLHQKVFEPRFLYHCDKMGYLVWGEHANWMLDISRPEAWQGFLPEWLEILKRDYNHPSIIGWCPLNETQQNQNPHFVKMLRDMTKAYDPTRPYIDASGWTHQGTLSDIPDAHHYEQNPDAFRALFGGADAPPFISEYGGTRCSADGWGYGAEAKDAAELLERFRALTKILMQNPAVSALCYTQLTDVEQEQNGLHTYDRQPKLNPADVKSILMQTASVEKQA